MRKTIWTGIAALLCVLTSCSWHANEQYDSLLKEQRDAFNTVVSMWNDSIPPHFRRAMALEKEAKENPRMADSLLTLAGEERRIGTETRDRFEQKMKFHDDSSSALSRRYLLRSDHAFEIAYRRRNDIGKDSLAFLLKKATPRVRRSKTGQITKKYLETIQPGVGDKFVTFDAWTADGAGFDWGQAEGKYILFVDDGLWCMTHGMDNSAPARYFKGLYRKYGRDRLLIVLYQRVEDVGKMKEIIAEYGVEDFAVISDLQGELCTPSWLYGDQVSPTCIYVDAEGTIVNISEGLDPDYIEKEFIKE